MLYVAFKAAISGLLVMAISEAAKRNPAFGALIASLPVVSILGMMWLWRETGDTQRIASHAEATFWLVLPSLPMFLVLPWMLRNGWSFWAALGLNIALTAGLYGAMTWVMEKFGIAGF